MCPLALNFDSNFIRGNAHWNTTEHNLSGLHFIGHTFLTIFSRGLGSLLAFQAKG